MAFNLTSETIANIEKEKSTIDKMIREREERAILEQLEIEVLNSKPYVEVQVSENQSIPPPSEHFSSLTTCLWESANFSRDTQFLLASNIETSTAQQCNSREFWKDNVMFGRHLSFEQWQPIFKSVYAATQQTGVDENAYVLFAQAFLKTIVCDPQQREEMFHVLQNTRENPTNTLMNTILEKQNKILDKINRSSVAHELKRKFKG